MFKVGDKVSLVDETGVFTVQSIAVKTVIIRDEFGFDQECSLNELVHVLDSRTIHNASILVIEEEKANKGGAKKSQPHKKNQRKQKQEYDLHAGVLIGSTAGMSNHEILTEQLDYAREMIDKARRVGDNYVIFIHGKGKGKLRAELHKMLKGIDKIDFYDADFSKYSLGATEVHIL